MTSSVTVYAMRHPTTNAMRYIGMTSMSLAKWAKVKNENISA